MRIIPIEMSIFCAFCLFWSTKQQSKVESGLQTLLMSGLLEISTHTFSVEFDM